MTEVQDTSRGTRDDRCAATVSFASALVEAIVVRTEYFSIGSSRFRLCKSTGIKLAISESTTPCGTFAMMVARAMR